MRKVGTLVQRGCKAVEDLNLLKVLQSEIQHELSTDLYPRSRRSSLGDFVVEWDSPQSQDVVLRKKCESGEEVAVSAMLMSHFDADPEEESLYPRDVEMKVCVKKPAGSSSILQFDCEYYELGGIAIWKFYYLQSPARIGPSVYRGRSYRSIDLQGRLQLLTHYVGGSEQLGWSLLSLPKSYLNSRLQDALHEYLAAKGIGEELCNFLIHHLHKKEQGQYVNWLQKLESFVAKPE